MPGTAYITLICATWLVIAAAFDISIQSGLINPQAQGLTVTTNDAIFLLTRDRLNYVYNRVLTPMGNISFDNFFAKISGK